jgi:hypothetical protein
LLLELESNGFEFDKEKFLDQPQQLNLNLFRFRFICLRIDYRLDVILD